MYVYMYIYTHTHTHTHTGREKRDGKSEGADEAAERPGHVRDSGGPGGSEGAYGCRRLYACVCVCACVRARLLS